MYLVKDCLNHIFLKLVFIIFLKYKYLMYRIIYSLLTIITVSYASTKFECEIDTLQNVRTFYVSQFPKALILGAVGGVSIGHGFIHILLAAEEMQIKGDIFTIIKYILTATTFAVSGVKIFQYILKKAYLYDN